MYPTSNQNLHRRDVLGDAMGFVGLSGVNPAVGTSYEAIWEAGGDYNFSVVGTPGISSSSAADASPSGTGARTARVFGLVAGAEAYEDIALNGQTQVPLVSAFTSIWRVEVLTTGTGGVNAGDVYVATSAVTAGVPNTATAVHAKILAGNGATAMTVFRAPTGRGVYVLGWSVSAESAASFTGLEAQVCERTSGSVIRVLDTIVLSAGPAEPRCLEVPLRVPAGHDVFIRAKAVGAATIVSARLELALRNG